jgi:hypothetical protein
MATYNNDKDPNIAAWEKAEKQTSKAPLMYKGWLIRRRNTPHQGQKYCAENLQTGVFINPLYNTWEQLRSVIDEMKESHI